jgi:hypothetical protein
MLRRPSLAGVRGKLSEILSQDSNRRTAALRRERSFTGYAEFAVKQFWEYPPEE